MDISKLTEPFNSKDIDWRIQMSGVKDGKPWARVMAYIQARAIQERLDEVCGPENWRNEFTAGPTGGVLCGISIQVERLIDERPGPKVYKREWVTKWDGADDTQFEKIKGGLSNAFKRAAVQWGIGRYLYDIPADYARFHDKGRYRDRLKAHKDDKGQWYNWDPPDLPNWALPEMERKKKPDKPPPEPGKKDDQEAGNYWDMLKQVQGLKEKIDEEEYYMIVNAYGAKKSNQVKKETMPALIKTLQDAVKRTVRFNEMMEKAVIELGIDNPVVKGLLDEYEAFGKILKKSIQVTVFDTINKEYGAATGGKHLAE